MQRDLKLIDADGSGTIDRLEYIQYLAAPDTSSSPGGAGAGKDTLDYNLKNMFDESDNDKDGL